MTQPKALQQATERLDAAVEALDSRLQHVFAESDGDVSVAALKEEIRFLTDERDQLLIDLEAERSRVRRLKAANDEVSGRLDTVLGTLKDMMPAMPG
ncbi:hypothetical protein AUC69_14035 [Methyloceanibacter superfactus]|jgi:hypothetical protein|uniref:DUF4164 domain-containing protein n=1 Tax=Methyloceanibacter superfactus TaxID=1774969 RepID=A0A1E3VT64_9HYPH|nr:DUF4164 family protein [Methyloceanibacter superfactus]ODR96712.1 hypothetical protein AUC69_14035 [Methyloceanibacter superfactus]